ncbi:MAG: peptidoglycan-binding protein [Gammaproteobacteria bacterium]|nr:peptidoglycan-binding protein [Gammaproteobacteria bacterium]
MRIASKAAVVAMFVFSGPALTQAQEVDNTQTLPNAKAGECYAKVITPAEFTTQTEVVVVQDAAERIKTIPAKYETVEQTILVKEAGRSISVVPAQYEDSIEQVEISPASREWIQKIDNREIPASPSMLDAVVRSGIDLEAVEPGSCFLEYYSPAEYRTENQQVMVSEASEEITVEQAQYQVVEERVVVKEASSQVIDVPATYRTETQEVLVEPAKSVWKPGRGPVERIDNSTGEIMCLVEIPARYETISKTVLDEPATTKRIDIPAVYKTVKVERVVDPAGEQRAEIPAEYQTVSTRVKVADASFYWLLAGEAPAEGAQGTGAQVCLIEKDAEYQTVKTRVLKSPPTTTVTEVPAEYQTIRVNRLLSPATEERIVIPEKTKTISKRVQIAPSRLEWRKVLCETNITREIISDLQRALSREGFDPGDIDGILGLQTNRAVEKYQVENNLDRGGLTYETLRSLELDL